MDKITHFPAIPIEILAFLLDKVGKAADISPRRLMARAVQPNQRQAEELYDAKITANSDINAPLTPKFIKISKVLLNPKTNLTFRVWAGEHYSIETNFQFPGYIREGQGVVLNQVDKSYIISAFYDDTDIVKELKSVLPVMPPLDDTLTFEASLPFAVAATLFGILDLYRLPEFIEAPPYSSAKIYGYIDGRWGLGGFENLLTYMLSLGYSSSPPTQTEIESSLVLLTKMGILEKRENDFYALSREFLPFVSALSVELSGFQWERISKNDNNELELVNRLWLFGGSGLVLMLMQIGNGRVFIASMDINQMKDFLIDDLLATNENLKSNEKGQSKAELSEFTQYEKEVEEFVAKSSSTVSKKQGIPRCPVCGAELLPGAKFCTHCGAPIPQKEENANKSSQLENAEKISPKIKYCPVCGVELLPGAKFCTQCGAKISD